jgi:hypothetical protein
MKSRLFLLVLFICIGIYFSACTSFQSSGFQMGMSTGGIEDLGDFSTTIYVNKFLGNSAGTNLFNISHNATSGPIREAIDKEIQKKGGTAAINISIVYKATFLQLFLNSLTQSIWAPSTVEIKGTVIKQN